jgi:hypothetical protein
MTLGRKRSADEVLENICRYTPPYGEDALRFLYAIRQRDWDHRSRDFSASADDFTRVVDWPFDNREGYAYTLVLKVIEQGSHMTQPEFVRALGQAFQIGG